MTLNRLPYDTIAGNLSEKGTFQQLIEYLRLAEEDLRDLGRLCKIANDPRADIWITIADSFRRTQDVVSHLGNSKTRTSLGYGKGRA